MNRNSFSVREVGIIFAGLISLIFLSALLIFANLKIVSALGESGDFYSMWIGSRAILFENTDPYDKNLSLQIQNLIYKRPAYQNENPYILNVPFHILAVFSPIAYISNSELASAVYMFICELLFLASLIFHFKLIEWSHSLLLYGVTSLSVILNFYTLESFRHISIAIPIGFACAAILLSLKFKQDELAGGLLALTMFQFEITGLFLILVFLHIFDNKRWQALAGFIMTTIILVAISYFFYPNWVLAYWSQSVMSFQLEYGFSLKSGLKSYSFQYADEIRWFIFAFLVGLILYEWYLARFRSFRQFYWVACLALAVTPFLGFHVDISQLFILLPIFSISVMYERWRSAGYVIFLFANIFILIIPWLVYLGWFIPKQTQDIFLYLLLPAATVLSLYWIRWWVVNPPLTFSDAQGLLPR